MKHQLAISMVALWSSVAIAQEAPEFLRDWLQVDQPVKAEVIVVLPPPDIEKYIAKVEKAAAAQPDWFAQFSKNAKPGVPLPYDEKLGLTKEEYAAYLVLWQQRESKVVEEVGLLLRHTNEGQWLILASGAAGPLSTLKFDEKSDQWKSANGVMSRIADVHAEPMSILGEWKGREWRFEETSSLSRVKENLAIGVTADLGHALLVYRAQEVSSEGSILLDKSVVVRLKKPANAPTPVSRPEPAAAAGKVKADAGTKSSKKP